MNEVFNETYQNYLKQLSEIDLPERANRLGLEMAGGDLLDPLFGTPYRVASSGIILLMMISLTPGMVLSVLRNMTK